MLNHKTLQPDYYADSLGSLIPVLNSKWLLSYYDFETINLPQWQSIIGLLLFLSYSIVKSSHTTFKAIVYIF